MADKVEKLPIKDEKLTAVQRLAKLDAERAEILASAKADALQKANEAVEELNALGFHYHLYDEDEKPNATTKGMPADAPCVICGFKTEKPHDKRAHKKHPGAFTDEELKQRGYVKVA
jgi:hypothetical protein